MNPDYTINPVALSRSLHGLSREGRARYMLWLCSHITAALPSDTALLLNASASIMWLREQVRLGWAGP